MELKDVFKEVQKLGLTSDQYNEVINIICETRNDVRTKTTDDAIKIIKQK